MHRPALVPSFLAPLLLTPIAAFALESYLPPRVPPARLSGPTAAPDRIVLTWSDDPATTQSVTWRTDPTVAEAVAEIAVATRGPEFARDARRVVAASTALETDLGAARYHTVTFLGLAPRTTYAYRVGDGTNWSEWSHFTTASDREAPFSFVYFGDAQNDIKSHWSRVVREAFRDAPRAAFLLHAGDLVNRADADAEWGEWCEAAGWILRSMPSLATPGNHEYAGRGDDEHLSRHWRPMFAFPEHGPGGLEETVYWIDHQGARIVSLNTNVDLDAQARWFDEVMQGCEARWKIVTMHHPVFSTARARDNPALRATLQPLFDRHAVDLVLQGHDHSYGRTDRMRHAGPAAEGGSEAHEHGEANVPVGVRARDDESGTVYVVSVSGPKMYRLDQKPFMVAAAENVQLYQIVSVDGPELRYSAYAATGELFDRFTLRKVEGRPNELVEYK